MGLTSIYGYFESRFGPKAHRTGAAFFILSRTIGAAFRLFLVALVLKLFILEPLGGVLRTARRWIGGMPWRCWSSCVIWAYTRQGGLGTIVWTDTLQTAAMLVAVVYSAYAITTAMDWSWGNRTHPIQPHGPVVGMGRLESPQSFHQTLHCRGIRGNGHDRYGSGYDAENLACKNLQEARWNMGSFSLVLVVVNVLFLGLGVLLYTWADSQALAIERADSLYPTVALGGSLGWGLGLVFLIGLLASVFSSADSAMTALTTSICVDLLGTEKQRLPKHSGAQEGPPRRRIGPVCRDPGVQCRARFECGVAIFTAANYTYGPILGLFASVW